MSEILRDQFTKDEAKAIVDYVDIRLHALKASGRTKEMTKREQYENHIVDLNEKVDELFGKSGKLEKENEALRELVKEAFYMQPDEAKFMEIIEKLEDIGGVDE